MHVSNGKPNFTKTKTINQTNTNIFSLFTRDTNVTQSITKQNKAKNTKNQTILFKLSLRDQYTNAVTACILQSSLIKDKTIKMFSSYHAHKLYHFFLSLYIKSVCFYSSMLGQLFSFSIHFVPPNFYLFFDDFHFFSKTE